MQWRYVPPVPAVKPNPTSHVNDPNAKSLPSAYYADDSQPMRGRLRMYLQMAGCRIVGFGTNAMDALRDCKRLKPDVAILDINMPPGSGFEAALKLANDKAVKHLFICSSNSQGIMTGPIGDAGVKFLKKPLSDLQVINAVKAALNGNAG